MDCSNLLGSTSFQLFSSPDPKPLCYSYNENDINSSIRLHASIRIEEQLSQMNGISCQLGGDGLFEINRSYSDLKHSSEIESERIQFFSDTNCFSLPLISTNSIQSNIQQQSNIYPSQNFASLIEGSVSSDQPIEVMPETTKDFLPQTYAKIRRPRGDPSLQNTTTLPKRNLRKEPTPRPYVQQASRQPSKNTWMLKSKQIEKEELSIEEQFKIILSMQTELPLEKTKSSQEMSEYVKYVFNHYMQKWIYFTKEDDKVLEQAFNSLINNQNCVKNILKSFGKYMDYYSDSLVIESIDGDKSKPEIIKKYKRYSGRCAVNNKFLQKTIKNPRYGKQFKYFLNFYSLDWLIKSRVEDKIIMLVSIFFLSRCFENQALLDNVHFYKRNFRVRHY